MMTKKIDLIFTIIICLIFTVTAFGKEKKALMSATIMVTAATVQQKTFQDTFKAIGSLSAINGIVVKAEAAGRVTQIYFKSGDYVKDGTPLVQIYPDVLKAELEKAKAELELSILDYYRYLDLYKKGFYSKSDLDRIQATLKSNRALVNQLKAQLSLTQIKAAFTGKLGLRQVSIGDYLNIGSSITNLEALEPIRVDFSVPEIYLGSLRLGDSVSIYSETYPKTKFQGKIYAFNSVIDQNTRQLDVRATIPNKDHSLLPGAFVEVTTFLDKPYSVLMIPQTAIVYHEKGNYVYRIIDQKVVKTNVELGEKLADNSVIVNKGLKQGEVVVTGGQLKLQDGAPVVIQQSPPQQQSAKTPDKKQPDKGNK